MWARFRDDPSVSKFLVTKAYALEFACLGPNSDKLFGKPLLNARDSFLTTGVMIPGSLMNLILPGPSNFMFEPKFHDVKPYDCNVRFDLRPSGGLDGTYPFQMTPFYGPVKVTFTDFHMYEFKAFCTNTARARTEQSYHLFMACARGLLFPQECSTSRVAEVVLGVQPYCQYNFYLPRIRFDRHSISCLSIHDWVTGNSVYTHPYWHHREGPSLMQNQHMMRTIRTAIRHELPKRMPKARQALPFRGTYNIVPVHVQPKDMSKEEAALRFYAIPKEHEWHHLTPPASESDTTESADSDAADSGVDVSPPIGQAKRSGLSFNDQRPQFKTLAQVLESNTTDSADSDTAESEVEATPPIAQAKRSCLSSNDRRPPFKTLAPISESHTTESADSDTADSEVEATPPIRRAKRPCSSSDDEMPALVSSKPTSESSSGSISGSSSESTSESLLDDSQIEFGPNPTIIRNQDGESQPKVPRLSPHVAAFCPAKTRVLDNKPLLLDPASATCQETKVNSVPTFRIETLCKRLIKEAYAPLVPTRFPEIKAAKLDHYTRQKPNVTLTRGLPRLIPGKPRPDPYYPKFVSTLASKDKPILKRTRTELWRSKQSSPIPPTLEGIWPEVPRDLADPSTEHPMRTIWSPLPDPETSPNVLGLSPEQKFTATCTKLGIKTASSAPGEKRRLRRPFPTDAEPQIDQNANNNLPSYSCSRKYIRILVTTFSALIVLLLLSACPLAAGSADKFGKLDNFKNPVNGVYIRNGFLYEQTNSRDIHLNPTLFHFIKSFDLAEIPQGMTTLRELRERTSALCNQSTSWDFRLHRTSQPLHREIQSTDRNFVLMKGKHTFKRAEAICLAMNAELVYTVNKDMLDRLYRFMVGKRLIHAWAGVRPGKQNEFHFANGQNIFSTGTPIEKVNQNCHTTWATATAYPKQTYRTLVEYYPRDNALQLCPIMPPQMAEHPALGKEMTRSVICLRKPDPVHDPQLVEFQIGQCEAQLKYMDAQIVSLEHLIPEKYPGLPSNKLPDFWTHVNPELTLSTKTRTKRAFFIPLLVAGIKTFAGIATVVQGIFSASQALNDPKTTPEDQRTAIADLSRIPTFDQTYDLASYQAAAKQTFSWIDENQHIHDMILREWLLSKLFVQFRELAEKLPIVHAFIQSTSIITTRASGAKVQGISALYLEQQAEVLRREQTLNLNTDTNMIAVDAVYDVDTLRVFVYSVPVIDRDDRAVLYRVKAIPIQINGTAYALQNDVERVAIFYTGERYAVLSSKEALQCETGPNCLTSNAIFDSSISRCGASNFFLTQPDNAICPLTDLGVQDVFVHTASSITFFKTFKDTNVQLKCRLQALSVPGVEHTLVHIGLSALRISPTCSLNLPGFEIRPNQAFRTFPKTTSLNDIVYITDFNSTSHDEVPSRMIARQPMDSYVRTGKDDETDHIATATVYAALVAVLGTTLFALIVFFTYTTRCKKSQTKVYNITNARVKSPPLTPLNSGRNSVGETECTYHCLASSTRCSAFSPIKPFLPEASSTSTFSRTEKGTVIQNSTSSSAAELETTIN